MSDARYRTVGPPVVYDTIEGETVIINLDSGVYYSVDGAGATAWIELERGASAGDLVDALALAFEGERDAIRDAVDTFVHELVGEGLVREASAADDDDGAGRVVEPSTARRAGATRLPFDGIALNRYSDLTELLLIDPIHDVDTEGWPLPRPNG